MKDVKELFIEGLEAVADDSMESHKELTLKITELEKKFDGRFNKLEDSMNQIIEHIIKPRGKVAEFFSSKKFLVMIIVMLIITMLAGIGFNNVFNITLDKADNIATISKSLK